MNAAPVYAQQAPQLCFANEVQIEVDAQPACDLAINKEVSVNGGAFTPADTLGAAVQSTVGDTITWRITITDLSVGYVPYTDIAVSDILPSQVSYVSHTASVGTYDQAEWVLPTSTMVGEFDYESLLPAVLTIQTTATTVGVAQNTAAFSTVFCDGPCGYFDSNDANDSNDAFVRINLPSQPQVLGSTTTPQVLAATGTSSIVLTIAVGTGLVLAAIFLQRFTTIRTKTYKNQ